MNLGGLECDMLLLSIDFYSRVEEEAVNFVSFGSSVHLYHLVQVFAFVGHLFVD